MRELATMTGTFILLWNPIKWSWDVDEYSATVIATEVGGAAKGEWSMGRRKSGVAVGDEFFLQRQGFDRGIIGWGHFTGTLEPVPHWDSSRGGTTYGADLVFDRLVDTPERVPIETLRKIFPDVNWDRLQSSGVKLRSGDAGSLRSLWESHLGQLPYRSPEEGDVHVDGGMTRVMTNRYERYRGARAKCLER